MIRILTGGNSEGPVGTSFGGGVSAAVYVRVCVMFVLAGSKQYNLRFVLLCFRAELQYGPYRDKSGYNNARLNVSEISEIYQVLRFCPYKIQVA